MFNISRNDSTYGSVRDAASSSRVSSVMPRQVYAPGPGARTAEPFSRRRNMILRIHHVQLAIPPGGEERARAFYGGVLGMRGIEKPAHLEGLGGLWFECGESGMQLRLGVE